MRRTVRITFRFLQLSILLLVVGIVAGILNRNGGHGGLQLVAILGSTWGGLGLILCPIFILIFKRYAKRADQILAGTQTLAHWTCTPQEWERHIQVEKTRVIKNIKVIALILLISLVLVCVMVFLGVKSDDTPTSPKIIAIILCIMVGTVGLIGFLASLVFYLPLRRMRHPQSRDVYIGLGGLIFAGKFASWEVMGASLQKVFYEPGDPGTILFRWYQPGAGAYATSAPVEILVPVPKANHPDAHHVVEAFKNQFKGLQ